MISRGALLLAVIFQVCTLLYTTVGTVFLHKQPAPLLRDSVNHHPSIGPIGRSVKSINVSSEFKHLLW